MHKGKLTLRYENAYVYATYWPSLDLVKPLCMYIMLVGKQKSVSNKSVQKCLKLF